MGKNYLNIIIANNSLLTNKTSISIQLLRSTTSFFICLKIVLNWSGNQQSCDRFNTVFCYSKLTGKLPRFSQEHNMWIFCYGNDLLSRDVISGVTQSNSIFRIFLTPLVSVIRDALLNIQFSVKYLVCL